MRLLNNIILALIASSVLWCVHSEAQSISKSKLKVLCAKLGCGKNDFEKTCGVTFKKNGKPSVVCCTQGGLYNPYSGTCFKELEASSFPPLVSGITTNGCEAESEPCGSGCCPRTHTCRSREEEASFVHECVPKEFCTIDQLNQPAMFGNICRSPDQGANEIELTKPLCCDRNSRCVVDQQSGIKCEAKTNNPNQTFCGADSNNNAIRCAAGQFCMPTSGKSVQPCCHSALAICGDICCATGSLCDHSSNTCRESPPTPTPIPTSSFTPTALATPTITAMSTATNTQTPTPTHTLTSTPTATPTSTATDTSTPTPTPTPTPVEEVPPG